LLGPYASRTVEVGRAAGRHADQLTLDSVGHLHGGLLTVLA